MQNETRACQNCRNDFHIEPDDFSFYQKYGFAPTFLSCCRMMRRFSFRNQNKLFKNKKSAFSEETILALVPPESGIKVMLRQNGFSDAWDQ